jgi:putative endonuclease
LLYFLNPFHIEGIQKLPIYYVYMLTTRNNTVLYTGVTNDLVRRCFEHKKGINKGFTQKYHIHKLVYYEYFDFIDLAIAREKQIKGLSRNKKNLLIKNFNPLWNDVNENDVIIDPKSLD